MFYLHVELRKGVSGHENSASPATLRKTVYGSFESLGDFSGWENRDKALFDINS